MFPLGTVLYCVVDRRRRFPRIIYSRRKYHPPSLLLPPSFPPFSFATLPLPARGVFPRTLVAVPSIFFLVTFPSLPFPSLERRLFSIPRVLSFSRGINIILCLLASLSSLVGIYVGYTLRKILIDFYIDSFYDSRIIHARNYTRYDNR